MTVAEMITIEAQAQSVPVTLALGVARAESKLNPNVPDGGAGEIGVFQLLPSTARQLGVDPRNLAQNIHGGVSYLRQLLARFGNPAAVLAAYNWGPGKLAAAMAKWGEQWTAHIPASTAGYITRILGWLPAPGPGAPAMRPHMPESMQPVLILAAIGLGAYVLAEANTN